MTIHNLTDLFKLVAAVVASVGGLGTALYFILQKALEAHFASRLEQTKHELQLEQQRMSIVYEHQKDSFRKLLTAMHVALKTLEDGWDDGEWTPIEGEAVAAFKAVASEERLFLDSRSDDALQLFASIMWTAAPNEPGEPPPESSEIAACHAQLEFISDRLAAHFRSCVGLSGEMADPLFEIELLGGIRLINRFHFASFKLPTKGPLKLDGQRPAEVVAKAADDTTLLSSELRRLKHAIISTDPSFFSVTLAEVDRYLECLSKKSGSLTHGGNLQN